MVPEAHAPIPARRFPNFPEPAWFDRTNQPQRNIITQFSGLAYWVVIAPQLSNELFLNTRGKKSEARSQNPDWLSFVDFLLNADSWILVSPEYRRE